MIGQILIVLIALLHIYILVLEMFLWDKLSGFLAAGLLWSLYAPESYALALANFFLACVLVAGIYGGLTASKKIIYIQAVPALIALIAVNFF